MKKGLIHIYTGDGKGKTTAAVGLAVRAFSHHLRVCFITFHKDPEKWGYAEYETLKNLGIHVFCFAKSHPRCGDAVSKEDMRRQCLEGMVFINQIMQENQQDVLILDEINISLREGYLKEEEILELMRKKPVSLEMILTGRGATQEIKRHADLVTLMMKEKHPFDSGLKGREGIEF